MGGGALSFSPATTLCIEIMNVVSRVIVGCAASLVLLGSLTYATEPSATIQFSGTAYSQERKTLLYTEHHHQSATDGKLHHATVVYLKPSGNVLAKKSLEYGGHPFTPNFHTENIETGEMESGELEDGKYRVWYQAHKDAKLTSGTINLSNDLIADAGFDLYVRAHMAQLLEGKTVRFQFLVPSRLAAYGFKATVSGNAVVLNRNAVIITVEMDNFLFRWLTQPFKLAYDATTGELLSYDGLSNLGDRRGKFKVHITYPEGQLSEHGQTP